MDGCLREKYHQSHFPETLTQQCLSDTQAHGAFKLMLSHVNCSSSPHNYSRQIKKLNTHKKKITHISRL